MYQLIALDMDGTLLNENKEISARCHAAISKLKKRGKRVVLATGRPLNGVIRYIEMLDLLDEKDYVVAFNGALVQSTKSKAIIYDQPLSIECYRELYDLSVQLGVHIHALTDVSVLTPEMNPYTEIEARINQIPVVVSSLDAIAPNTTIVKVMFVDDEKTLNRILPLLPQAILDKYSILRSTPYFLEFLDKRVNKGTGVSIIAKELGLTAEQVICVGDAGNDLDMIKYAGLGVAMGNARDEIKEAADYVTHSNENDGVAHVIEKFMLNQTK